MTVAPIRSSGKTLLADPDILALIYRRVSTEEQDDDGRVSLQTQDEDAREQVVRIHGARPLAVYTDMESGRKDDRREYQAMLARVRAEIAAGHRVVVVVAALARFGRRMAERVRAWEELKSLGVAVYSAREGGLVGELMYNLLAAVAQEEVRLLSERITRSNRAYRDAGWLRPGGCRWGYRWEPASEIELASGAPSIVLVEDDATGPYARELFERAARGESINSLAKWAARLPAEARGIGQNGAPRVLSYAGIRQILRAPVYTARHGTYDDDVLDRPCGKWAPLVTDEQWEAIHGTGRLHRTRASGDGRYPLTGLLWCSACRQHRMGGRSIKPRLRGRRMTVLRREYACTGHVYGSRCQMVVPAVMIEQALTALLQQIYARLTQAGMVDRARQFTEREANAVAKRIGGTRLGALRTDLTKAETLLTESWIQNAEGTLTATAYATIQARLSPRIDELKEQIAALEAATPKPEIRVDMASLGMVLAAARGWADALADAAEHPDGRQAIGDAARLLIDRVWAVRTARGQYRLDVLYTEAGMKVLKVFTSTGEETDVERYDSANALYHLSTFAAAAL